MIYYVFIATDLPLLKFVRGQSHQPNDLENVLWRSKSEDLPFGSFGQWYDVLFGTEDLHLKSDGMYVKDVLDGGDSSTRVLVMAAKKTT